jgi:hypothetical protein
VHVAGSWDRILDVSADFHRAAAAVEHWPAWMDARSDPWTTGVRVAWSEQAPDPTWPHEVLDVLERLDPHLGLARRHRTQIIHRDLAGNVLFADELGLPPAVIDISPQLRPAAFADAVVAADAVAWLGAPLDLAARVAAADADGDEMLARASAFRISAAAGLFPDHPERGAAEVDAFRPLLALLEPRA